MITGPLLTRKNLGLRFLVPCFLSLLFTIQAQEVSSAQMEKEAWQQINEYRVNHGLNSLAWSDDITAIARGHSRDMALHRVPFGHSGFMDRVHQAQDALAGTSAYGENVFMANYPGDQASLAVKQWLNSPEHYKNIVGNYNVTGMGVWRTDDGYVYFTQFFAKQAEVSQATPVLSAPLVSGLGMGGSPFTR